MIWASCILVFASAESASAFPAESGRMHRVDDDAFHLSVEDDGGDESLPPKWRAWWYKRLDGVIIGRPTTIEVDRLSWAYPSVAFYSYDQHSWNSFEADEVERPTSDTMSIRHIFSASPVWVAQREPFTADDLDARLDAWKQQAGALAGVDFRVKQLGNSPDGAPVYMVTVGGCSGVSARQQVWVHARVHPGEPQASWMAAGMVDFLLGDSPLAARARSRLTFYVVALWNVDGVARGHYRTNAGGQDLENLWDVTDPPAEVQLLRGAIEQASSPEPFLAALNLHSSHAPARQPPFLFPHFGPESLGYAPEEARLWQRQMEFAATVAEAVSPLPFAAYWADRSPPPAPDGRSFLAKAMPERWWWNWAGADVMAVTVEAVDGQVGAGGRWARADDARRLGGALACGLLALADATDAG